MVDLDPTLQEKAQTFADEVAEVLNGTITHDATVAARVEPGGGRFTVGPIKEETGHPLKLHLPITDLASVRLGISFSCAWDAPGKYLMVDRSAFTVAVGHLNEPLIRFEYLRGRTFAPAHIQVHGESGALGLHLGAIGSTKTPKLQDLHLPVGGKRFRVCLEDVIEFLIKDLDVPGRNGWQAVVEQGRERWYHRQLGAAIRSDQDTAITVLEELGYTLTPGEG